ncbi:hypothetical protein CTI12_AA146680 [Artemisia annua]|uniref:Uncharacterized protein n=1 Tax=Artemisia annua TaxID=35608 RepID=A0A2U1PIN8_ARTAN|nr:hypothetical protein CTI12_AA146680 [Artemisia annua]
MESFKGFLQEVACFSSRCVTTCSREAKPKTLKEYPVFMNITIKVSREGSWPVVLKKISDNTEGVISCTIEKNGMVHISGDFCPSQIMKCMNELGRKEKLVRWGYSLKHLVKKTEAPSSNTTNPPNTVGGNATGCSGHHNEKPMTSDKTRDKSS